MLRLRDWDVLGGLLGGFDLDNLWNLKLSRKDARRQKLSGFAS